MLVLGRRRRESVVIRENGEIVGSIDVLDFTGTRAKLGFTFDSRFEVVRAELLGRDSQPPSTKEDAAE